MRAASDRDLPLEMGTLVKMQTRVSIAYGMVTGLRVPLPSLEPSDKDLRLVELELVGEIRDTDGGRRLSARTSRPIRRWMSRSISPRRRISRRFMRAPRWRRLRSARSTRMARTGLYPDRRAVRQAFQHCRHHRIGKILWSSQRSSGPSSIKARTPMSYCSIPHNEYARAFGDRAIVLSPGDGLHLPYWLFNFEELAEIVIGPDRNAEQVEDPRRSNAGR